MLVDNDTFDRAPLTARQARFAPWCLAPQAYCNAASGQGSPAFGGARRPAWCHQMGHYQQALVLIPRKVPPTGTNGSIEPFADKELVNIARIFHNIRWCLGLKFTTIFTTFAVDGQKTL
jgi:hypothetical protein